MSTIVQRISLTFFDSWVAHQSYMYIDISAVEQACVSAAWERQQEMS